MNVNVATPTDQRPIPVIYVVDVVKYSEHINAVLVAVMRGYAIMMLYAISKQIRSRTVIVTLLKYLP